MNSAYSILKLNFEAEITKLRVPDNLSVKNAVFDSRLLKKPKAKISLEHMFNN